MYEYVKKSEYAPVRNEKRRRMQALSSAILFRHARLKAIVQIT